MEELLREFVGESLDMIEVVAGDLVAWEADPHDKQRLDAIFRTVHTIKGSSSFFDLPRVTALAHAAEELLDALRSGQLAVDGAVVASVLAGFDGIRQIIGSLAQHGVEPAGEDGALIARLADTLHQRTQTTPETTTVGVPADAPRAAEQSVVPPEWRSVRVPLTLLDEVMSGVSDLVLARNEFAGQLRGQGFEPESLAAFTRLSGLLSGVRASVSLMRMSPLNQLFSPLPRLVRQLADELGKQVRLVTDGGEVEIDREVMESLRDPIVHALRNAIDHGIEPEEVRKAAGKPVQAVLRVSGRQVGNRIKIAIEDDGAGLAEARLIEKAIASGHLTAERAAKLSSTQIAALVFLPGLSTAKAVSDISGRGVGMDVVKANIERLGGGVRVDNRPGRGVTLTIDVPMTLTIISALAVPIAGQEFAIPRSAIAEVLLSSNESVECLQSGGVALARVRGNLLPRCVLENHLGLPVEMVEERSIVLCRLANGRTLALDVPDVRDQEELVIKPLPPLLRQCGTYNGFSLPDNGQPMLVIDVDGIASHIVAAAEGGLFEDVQQAEDSIASQDEDRWLCFVPLGVATQAALPMHAVQRIVDVPVGAISRAGSGFVATIDGELLRIVDPAVALPEVGALRMVRITHGGMSMLLTVAEVTSLARLDIQLSDSHDARVIGVAMHDATVIEMWDVATLFPEAADQRIIWIVDGAAGGWARHVVQPALERAGYRVRHAASRDAVTDRDAPILCINGDDGHARLNDGDGNGLLQLINELPQLLAAGAA